MYPYIIQVANADTSIPSTGTSTNATSIEGIVDGMLNTLVGLFTENIGTVLTFAVSFMVLALLLALARRFFRL